MRSFRAIPLAVLAVLLAAGLAFAEPVFGPQTVESIGDTDVLFNPTFDVGEGGPHTLYVRNGDDVSSRIDAITISINGEPVVGIGGLDLEPAGLRRPVQLIGGTNELAVTLSGAPGSFVTIAIVPTDELPVFSSGRLLLPWGRDDGLVELALALRNGSPRFPRVVRVVFFNPDGSVAAASRRVSLPPRAGLAFPVPELLDGAGWEVGSVAVFWAGPGTARLFGSARQVGEAGQWDLEPLQQAGYHLFRGGPDPDARRTRLRGR